MNPSRARFSIERKDATGGDWHPLTSCNTLDYARMVASLGAIRHIGVYRVVHTRTGKAFNLLPKLARKAA
ncbi:MAG: hypothetical protein ACM336_08075 [Acidobacteriota bacterium]